MKIVCFVASLSQPRCIKRVKFLHNAGYEVIVYGFTRGYYDNNEYPKGVKVHNWGKVDNGKGYLRRLFLIWNLQSKALSESKDAIVFYCFSFETALMMALKPNCKFIYEISDLIYTYWKLEILQYLCKKVTKWIIQKSFKTVVTSEGFKEHLYGQQNCEKILIQPNKLDTFFLNSERNLLKVSLPLSLRFAYIGAFRYPNTVFRFAKIIGEKYPQHKFFFWGNSDLTPLVEDLAAKYENIRYFGKFRNPEDLASIYANVDIVVACYDTKTLNERVAEPNKLYEALCFCKPIVVSTDTFLSKKVEHLKAGFTIDASVDSSIVKFVDGLTKEKIEEISKIEYFMKPSEYIDSSSGLLQVLDGLNR